MCCSCQGVMYSIQVAGPVLAKEKPDCVGDEDQGATLLKKAYYSLFEQFYKLSH